MNTAKNQIAIIGLGTMGSSLARNFARNQISTAVFNRTPEVSDQFIANYKHEGPLYSYPDLPSLVASLEAPRQIILMVTAGKVTNAVIEQLIPLLDPDDTIIDGGNSNYLDTIARTELLAKHQLNFIGCGISGGEKGALEGPSLMPSGPKPALDRLIPLLEKIAAKDFSGNPCVHPFDGTGSGHLIKTVHNGIEYAIMQLLSDTYELLRKLNNLSAPEIAKLLESFKATELDGFLLDTAIQVLKKADTFNKDHFLINYISDQAGSKGTGTWTAQTALEYGVPIPIILAAVTARQLSADPEFRSQQPTFTVTSQKLDNADILNALWLSVAASYIQGIKLIDTVATFKNWNIQSKDYLRVWQGGCIIRSKMLTLLPFESEPNISEKSTSLQNIILTAHQSGVSVPAFSATYDYLKYKTTANLPTNLVQGMRDCFGAHTYQRTDRQGTFTENWD